MNNSTETPYAYDPPAWAIAGHAVHGQCRQHQGNAEGICHWQPVSTCRKCLEWLLPDRLLIHNHVLTQLNGARISDYILSLSSTSYITWCLSDFYSTKMINSSQFMETLKVKTTSLKEPMHGWIIGLIRLNLVGRHWTILHSFYFFTRR